MDDEEAQQEEERGGCCRAGPQKRETKHVLRRDDVARASHSSVAARVIHAVTFCK